MKNEGSNWTNTLKFSFVPEISHQSIGQTCSSIKNKFSELGVNMKKDSGINALPESEKDASENLFNLLEEYGIFTVRTEEVELWLQILGVNAHKSVWLPQMFDSMGSEPRDSSFVKPSEGDVWEFMARINKWISNER